MTAHCYSIRRLSPYQGTLQIIVLKTARAISVDGINWRIQVLQEMPEKTFAGVITEPHFQRYVAFGVWSRTNGLARVPIHPIAKLDNLKNAADALLAILPAMSQQVPFAAEDCLEFWLLDGNTYQPLALLDSAAGDSDSQTLSCANLEWQPAPHSDLSFHSPTLQRHLEQHQKRGSAPQYHRHLLAEHIHKSAGRPFSAQWFQRQTDGSGRGLHGKHLPVQLQQRVLQAASFPELMVRGLWEDSPQTQALILDFYRWQAALLLLLPHLSDAARAWLEEAACQQHALEVYRWHTLYPKIINQALINKALVEAVLRKSHTN